MMMKSAMDQDDIIANLQEVNKQFNGSARAPYVPRRVSLCT